MKPEAQPAWKTALRAGLPDLLAALGGGLFLLQVIYFARTQLSVLDEGSYLLTGYWFATDVYQPFQEFGPWTNQMPLAFLIPGYIQAWFGPSLLVGRSFAVLVALIFLLGLCLLCRQLGGRWWAAAAVAAVALNPANLKIYSLAVSQGLVAALLVWMLYFGLGKRRAAWQLYASGGLAALLALTRLNMTPVLILLLLYFIWEHGWRAAMGPALFCMALLVLGYTLYWPGILETWARFAPAALTPFLESWRLPAEAQPSWLSDTNLHGRWLSFLDGLRFSFLPLAGGLGAGLLWPRQADWRDKSAYRAAVFLAVTFVLLLLMHAAVTLFGTYCVFCFSSYLTFFNFLPLVLFILVWPQRAAGSVLRWRVAGAALWALPALVAYGSYPLLGAGIPPARWVRSLLQMELPRFGSAQFLKGRVPLWGLLENAFGLEYNAAFRILQNSLGHLLFALGGLLFGLLLWWLARRDWTSLQPGLGGYSRLTQGVLILLLAGLIFSLTPLLSGGYQSYDCGEDMLAAYGRLGAELDKRIDPGAHIFWRGGRSAVPLLYVSDVDTYPTLLHGDYTYFLGGDGQELQRRGFWNQDLLHVWLREADVILVEEDLYRTWMQEALENGPFDQQPPTAPLAECSPRSSILFYRYDPNE